ncbi:hypothetical protein QJS10_CPA09g00644 [Acorus calamus]|uniref:DUF1365 domain-containing protein n=1 Tax=Acorus calamus TaxID=4465 RepID=A0AAV9E790_ACOCL|nr:hypothetical protein QJS10_CPA09g00644 [Acorus calamus]
MEAVYLICSLASTSIRSTVQSLILAVRSLLLLRSPTTTHDDDGEGPVRLYEGHVRHVRTAPARHAFTYPVRYALLDLDVAAPSKGHVSADEARRVATTDGPVMLLTIPESVGYEQNPLSVYYCFDRDGSLEKCIAEVTNTPWGERVTFVFRPGADLVAKPLHVSPFMDMLGNWSIHANPPGENLFLMISSQHPTFGNYFTATLKAKRVGSTSSSLHSEIFFWLMPHKVAFWIYWQAVKLWWKNISFIQHPRYGNPGYREEALVRDQKLKYSQTMGEDKCNYVHLDECQSNSSSHGDAENRYCVWRDAQWPWC